jgi:SpoIID/LytB domain protein
MRVWIRAVVAAALVLSVGSVPSATAVTYGQTYWVAATGQLVIDGHGFGHGHGMSQYGAQGAALQGLTHEQILAFYYPGTTLSTIKGNIRVLITGDHDGNLKVKPVAGLAIRDLGAKKTYPLPTVDGVKAWRIKPDASGHLRVAYRTDKWHGVAFGGSRALVGAVQFNAPTPITLLLPGRHHRQYRGSLRLASDGKGGWATVNVASLEDYVRGVVGSEMPSSWSPEAVQSQAVAARTYAAWERKAYFKRYYQVCDTSACQVYGGVGAEDSNSNAAVDATAKQILRYNGVPAFTQFASSNGGWETAGSQPYLVSQADPYDGWSGNSMHNWTVKVNASKLEAAYPAIGTLQSIQVTDRDGNGQWGGRVGKVTLAGTNGQVQIYGTSFAYILGLRTNWFTIEATPIMKLWKQIGGSGSQVGDPLAAESSVAGGAQQQFQSGWIYYADATGAHELYGGVSPRYRHYGGPASDLGFPVSGVQTLSGGISADFQDGSIYVHSGHGRFVLTGDLAARYTEHGGTTSDLGWPTSSMKETDYGYRATFEHGYIDYFASTQSTRVVVK